MADLKPNGMATAVALAGGAGDLGLAGDDQDDLFGAACDGPLSPAPVGKSGPQGGRPKGARNRSTEAMRQLFLARYRSPLMGLGEIYSRSPEALARELKLYRKGKIFVQGPNGSTDGAWVEREDPEQLDLEAAFRLQLEAMQVALPYVHQKLPQAVTVEDRPRGLLVINVDGGAEGDEVAILFGEPQQNQGLIEQEPAQSDGRQSDEEAK